MFPLIGFVAVCAVSPKSSPPPPTTSSSPTHRHYRDIFQDFPKIPFQDDLRLTSANFHEILDVTGQKSLWLMGRWEAGAGGGCGVFRKGTMNTLL